MRFCRGAVTWLLILAAVGLVGATGALAAGPSAGDQQYVDPLGGSTTPRSHTSTPSSSSSPTPSATPAVSSSNSSSAGTATATTTTTTTTTTTASSAGTLPRTGYDGTLAAVIGVGLVGTGLALRRRASSR